MTQTLQLSEARRDAWREVANIAAGHAAAALAQLVGRRTMITVPELSVAPVEEIPEMLGYTGQRTVVIAMRMFGDFCGSFVFLMAEAQAYSLSALLLDAPVMSMTGFDELARSSLSETANIIGGAYTAVLGSMLRGMVMLSVPAFGVEPPDGVLSRHRESDERGAQGLCIETRLSFNGAATEFGGHIVLVPSAHSLEAMVSALAV